MRSLLRIDAPIQEIRARFVKNTFLVNNRPYPKFIWKDLNKDQIITLYNNILRGYINYYYYVTNYGKTVSFVRWVLWFSLAKLLSAKYSKSVAKIVKIYGLDFKGKDKIGFFKPKYHNLPLKFNNKQPSNPAISLNTLSKSIAN